MTFRVSPYVGALPIQFVHRPIDVEMLLGPPSSVGVNILGERDEDRNSVKIRYSTDDDAVAEIAFLPDAEVTFNGVDLFREPHVLELLCSLDADPFVSYGFVVFPKLGITLAGYHDNDESQKGITVFRRGRWDDSIANSVPLAIPRR